MSALVQTRRIRWWFWCSLVVVLTLWFGLRWFGWLPLAAAAQPVPHPIEADLLLHTARIWTGDAAQPEAEAIVAWQGRILFIGSSADAKARFRANRVIDAQGRRVVPGFHDSHVHFLGGGMGLAQVQLKDAADEAEFGKRLQLFDRQLPKARWLLGGNWDHDRTFKGVLPTAALLDKYVKDRPVFLRRYDGHMALANSAALKLAGITAQTPDPNGGEIVRLPGGKEPSGVLRDTAMGLVQQVISRSDSDQQEAWDALKAALQMAREMGVTSVDDMAGGSTQDQARLLRMYQLLLDQRQLTCRINLYWPLGLWQDWSSRGVMAHFGNDYLRIGGLKGYADGSLGASTAKMFKPYLHEPHQLGVWVTPPGAMKGLIQEADQAGLAICVHAIGDEANAVMLDIFADAAKNPRNPPRRYRIEHAQILRREDYPRFKAAGVIASMQPYHIIDDGRWAEGRIGKERCQSSYACRSLLDAGAMLAFGSDWPVAPLSPILGIDAAVRRRTLDGLHPEGWFPEQSITVAEALRAYTFGSAFAAGQEHIKGQLKVGYLADLVMLDRDLLDAQARSQLDTIKVLLTIVGGEVVYERQ